LLDLDWLLRPHDKNVFLNEVWQRRPQVLATGRAGYFETLFSKRAVERIIEFSQPRSLSLRLASAASNERIETPLSPNGRINVDQMRKLYLKGQTVVLNSVEDFDPTVAQLARAIETEMGARVQVNSYLTPASSQGFRPHYDTHDVLVAQIEGEKLWKVYGRDSVCPLNEMVDGDPKFRESTQPPEEICLRSGDLLYLPRGWIHEAVTDKTASLHLTIGIHAPLGIDLLYAALEALVDRHAELRETLPVGPLGAEARRARLEARFAELVELFASNASAAEAARAIDDQLLRRGRSGGDGHLFEDIENLPDLTSDTVLQRRTNVCCRVLEIDDGVVGLQFLNGLIKGPAAFQSAMSFIATRVEPFAPSDLPGLSEDEQLVLASSLVTDGLCHLCGKK
jgi:ribosomal protein L16 Arg81 hydroxylase